MEESAHKSPKCLAQPWTERELHGQIKHNGVLGKVVKSVETRPGSGSVTKDKTEWFMDIKMLFKIMQITIKDVWEQIKAPSQGGTANSWITG